MNRRSPLWKWLYPGMHVKRWIALGFIGLILFLLGAAIMLQAHRGRPPLILRLAQWIIQHLHAGIRPGLFGLCLFLLGGVLCLFALGKLIQSLMSALDPEIARGGLVDVVYTRRKLAQGKRVVVIGGGTGLSTLLRGLKRYTSNITAIVTVADDGGSSGKLRRQLNILPPGDIRNCLVALADAEPQMTELFQFRFRASMGSERLPANGDGVPKGEYAEGLRDHAFGNLLIAAMCAINNGDFERAVQETSRVLNIRGRVLPSTVTPVKLRAEMEDGSILEGETNIAESPLRIKRVALVPLDPNDKICPVEEALDAIAEADLIVLGPGSLFTSILPNLLVPGIPEAIRRSQAQKAYVCNVMTQPGETDGFSACDHVRALEIHVGPRLFTYVVVNNAVPEPRLLEKYRRAGSVLVEPDTDRLKAEGYRPVVGAFISETDVVRHDAVLLAEALMGLIGGKSLRKR